MERNSEPIHEQYMTLVTCFQHHNSFVTIQLHKSHRGPCWLKRCHSSVHLVFSIRMMQSVTKIDTHSLWFAQVLIIFCDLLPLSIFFWPGIEMVTMSCEPDLSLNYRFDVYSKQKELCSPWDWDHLALHVQIFSSKEIPDPSDTVKQ